MTHAVRLGLRRGWIEFKHLLTSPADVGFTVVSTAVFIVAMYFQRDTKMPGTDMSLAAATLPGVLALIVPINALLGAVGALSVEREDGTLLRAKALPQGMVGHLVGKVVSLSLSTVASVALMLAAGLLFVPELAGVGVGGWLAIPWYLLLGLLAPVILRRMARRESGSLMEARRQQALQRFG